MSQSPTEASPYDAWVSAIASMWLLVYSIRGSMHATMKRPYLPQYEHDTAMEAITADALGFPQ